MDEGGEESGEPSNLEENIPVQDDIATRNHAILPTRKWSKLWLHASIMCGREFLYAVEIVLVTPIILQLGMPEKYYSFMWCFSPIIGILISPILGSRSDRCTSRFGRRRPYIVGLVIGALIGLTLLIFSKDIAALLGGSSNDNRRLWGVIVGIIGAQSMDFCLDQSETPLRAYTLDVCSPQDQQRAFALQTVFIGVGGAMGFIIDGIDWENTAISDFVGSQIKVVYIFAVITYAVTTIFNLISIKETPWKKRKTINPSNVKPIVASQLPLVRKSKSAQGMGYLASDKLQYNSHFNAEAGTSAAPRILVSYHDDESNQVLHDHSTYTRPLGILPRISMSKGLYISTSCPGGLNEYCRSRDESLSPLETSDSAYDENKNVQSTSDEANLEDVTLSLPALHIKSKSPTKERMLLHFLGSKFSSDRTLNSQDSMKVNESNSKQDEETNNKQSNGISKHSSNNKQLRTKDPIDVDLIPKIENDSSLNEMNNGIHCSTKSNPVKSKDALEEISHSGQTEKLLSQNRKKMETEKRSKPHHHDDEHPVSLRQIWMSVVTMPSQLRWLCVAQLLGFIGMETLLLWYTDLMGRVVYEGDPQAPANSTELANYNAGIKMGCWGLTIYSLAMIIFSVGMERFRLLSKFRISTIYSFAFLLVAATMTIMFIFPSQYVILVFSWCIGVTFAVMLTVPYVLVGKYHQNIKYVMKSPGDSRRGFGLDCAILACQMYVGNVVSAAISSPIIHLFGTCKAMLLTTGFCHFIAFFFAYFLVSYPGEKKIWCRTASND